MLVLTRYVGEEIVIGDDVRVTVVAITGNKFGSESPDPQSSMSVEARSLVEPSGLTYPKSSRPIRSKVRELRHVKRLYQTQLC